jgi:hypothetical protein
MHAEQRGDSPQVELPRWVFPGAALLGVLLFAMVVLLTLTLIQLHDSGGHIESQDKKVAALFDAARPLAARADELGGEVAPALHDAKTLVEPLLRGDSGDDLAAALDRFPFLAGYVQRLAGEAVPLLDSLDPGMTAASISAIASLATALAQDDRLVRLIDGASAALIDVSDHDLVARVSRTASRVRKLLAVQRQTRALQRRALGVQLRSLDVQRRSLEHVRSIDNKTGGQAPVSVP